MPEYTGKEVLEKLNEQFGTNFSYTDIWAKKPTTVKNQFIYFRNHLELFNDLILSDHRRGLIAIKRGKEKDVISLLKKDFVKRDSDNMEEKLRKKYIEKFLIFMCFSI